MDGNRLYYGDNLNILRSSENYIKEESIDLIYLDPPFNSNATYNVLYAEQDGSGSSAQIQAFNDTWKWDEVPIRAFDEFVASGPDKAVRSLLAFETLMPASNMLAYLTMMAPRLVELHKVLKPTGSIYLHCDPTASHYLRVLMDAVFGPTNFRNEIIWRRTGAHGKSRRFGPIHDTLLFYTKTGQYYWNPSRRPYMRGHVEEYFVHDEKGWRTNYYGNVLTGSGLRGGESGKPWKGVDPSDKGRHWAIPGQLVDDLGEDLTGLTQHQKLDRLYEMGFITFVPGDAWPIYGHYIEPKDGTPTGDIWSFQPYTNGTVFGTDAGIDEDVRWLSPRDRERIGYQTQKPLGLLERIIEASSKPGDIVLDPFCGCGTATIAAQKMNRSWIGIDITHLAIAAIKMRLLDSFGSDITKSYSTVGEPTTTEGAYALAAEDKYQFQYWMLHKVGARPLPEDRKKGADKGVDGRIRFRPVSGKTEQVILSVKGGALKATDVRDLIAVVTREKAVIGVLLTRDAPTKPMRVEAATAGTYQPPLTNVKYPKIQIITVEDIFNGATIAMPPTDQSQGYLQAGRIKKPAVQQLPLAAEAISDD